VLTNKLALLQVELREQVKDCGWSDATKLLVPRPRLLYQPMDSTKIFFIVGLFEGVTPIPLTALNSGPMQPLVRKFGKMNSCNRSLFAASSGWFHKSAIAFSI